MSDQKTNQQLRVLMRRSVASLIFVCAAVVLLAPRAAYADDIAPVEPPAPFVLPAVCTATPAPVLPTNPSETPGTPEGFEAPETPETPETPAAPVWTPLQLSAPEKTTMPTLTWQWNAPTAPTPEASFDEYGYALYVNGTLVTQGVLAPEALSYTYTAPAAGDGVYTLYVWVQQSLSDPEAAETLQAACGSAQTLLDTTPPVVVDNGYTLTDNQAVPKLTVEEPDVYYSWVVEGDVASVTVSDPLALNPIFTFLKDGTYTLRLFVADALGNTTMVSFTVTYQAPYVPGSETPLPPTVKPGPVDTYVPPTEVFAAQRSGGVAYTYDTATSADDERAEVNQNANRVAGAATDEQEEGISKNVATTAAIASSNQGWVILGVPWYWWLLGIAIAGTGILWYRSGSFRHSPDDL